MAIKENMDEAQFVQLIEQHQAIIHKICRLYRDTREDREDLFQEIVCQLWKSLSGFRGEAQFSTWMYRVALTTAITIYRKKKPAITYTADVPDQQETAQEQEEQREELFRALKQLDDADKALITLYLEGLSYQEISTITGLTETNIGTKLNRIKKRIQQLVKL
jgi:RNA polymerase sigma-70 factor (ECF subfamily)